MGRWAGYGKATIDSHEKISIYRLKKQGYLRDVYISGSIHRTNRGEKTGSAGISCDSHNKALTIAFTKINNETQEKQNFNYDIPLISTTCNYGGVRYWMQCKDCLCKVGLLYWHLDGYFYCRKCLDLCYDYQKESKRSRIRAKAMPGRWEDKEAEKLRQEIKYPYRNGKKTRKYKRYLRLTRGDRDENEKGRMEQEFLDTIRSK